MSATPSELAQIIELANNQLACLKARAKKVQDKYDYVNADNDVNDIGISTPVKMLNTKPGIGWASRAINTVSDRLIFDAFAKDSFGINDTFNDINARPTIKKVVSDTMIAGCAFLLIADETFIPFTALEATGVVNQKTGMLKYGLAVTAWHKRNKRYSFGRPKDYLLLTPNATHKFVNGTYAGTINNPTGRCLLHPVIHRASTDRPLGRSRITNTARRVINEVARTKRRYEIAAEFYSTPQRYINGLAAGAEKDENLDATIGKVWAINKDENDDKPEIGQLAQMSIDQFENQKKGLARDFCAETALTLRNLGYETGNPTSDEALRTMSDDLLLECQNAQVDIGEQIKQAAITLRLAIDQNDAIADGLKAIKPVWRPIFQQDLSKLGDALYKIFDNMPELKGTFWSYQQLGMTVAEAEELMEARKREASSNFMIGGDENA